MKKIIAIAAIVLLGLYASVYQVSETEQTFLTQFGKPVGNPVNSDPAKNEAGLHFKMPFIQTVNRLEKRILEWDGPANEMPTRDKLYVSVDNFARWRIIDPKAYYEKIRDERSAQSRLDDIIGSETRNVIAGHDLIEVVRDQHQRVPEKDETLETGNTKVGSKIGTLAPISYGRTELATLILKAAQPKVKAWGIEILDIQFKRINYKSGVVEKIYSRMTSERMQIAELFRSQGAGEAAKILGKRDRDLLEIESGAYRLEQEKKGAADATATKIYADAYNASPVAAEFYTFTKTLETYQKTLDKETTLIMTSDSDLFHLLKGIKTPPVATASPPMAPSVN
jgi:modulator of FtsH protease HflC